MFGFSSGALMTLSDDERHLLVSVVSVYGVPEGMPEP